MKIKNLLTKIDNISFDEAVGFVLENAEKENGKKFVVTMNTEIVMHARKDTSYEKVLEAADLLVNDSIGIKWARGIFGLSAKERIHGSDLFVKIAQEASDRGLSLGLLGAGEGVAKKTASILKEKYPGLKIAFYHQEKPEGNRLGCDILFVAFGSPKQEKWIYENLSQLDTKVAIGVGGTFDYVSGKVKRAPVFVRKIGLEWVFRLLRQPWRLKRQLVLPQFVLLVIKERFVG